MSTPKKLKNVIHLLTIAIVVSGLCLWLYQTYQQQSVASQASQEPQGSSTQQQVLGLVDEKNLTSAVVTRVVDGDTIVLADGRKVRYIGIDTPETKHPVVKPECQGQEAAKRNKQLVENKTVYLEKDVSDTDRYGRLLRYVWLDGVLINEQLVAEGLAFAADYPPDSARKVQLAQAQAKAQDAQLGIWGHCPLNDVEAVNQLVKETDQTLEQAASSSATPANPCVIKGNISAKGKLYHLPNCPSYQSTKIDESKNERWFCTEQEAMAAGWTKAAGCE